MSGWSEYYERANEVGGDLAWVELRDQHRRSLDRLMRERAVSRQRYQERVTHEALEPLMDLAQAAPEEELSYLRIVYLEWVTGIRDYSPAGLLAALRAAQAEDQKLAPVHQAVPSQNSRRA